MIRQMLRRSGAALLAATVGLALTAGLVLAAPSEQAPPPFPTRIMGSVTINGSAAPNGTTITVSVGGTQCGTGTTSGGSYDMVVTCPAGTATLSVNGQQADSFTLTPGQTYTRNLSVTTQQPTPQPTQQPTQQPGTQPTQSPGGSQQTPQVTGLPNTGTGAGDGGMNPWPYAAAAGGILALIGVGGALAVRRRR